MRLVFGLAAFAAAGFPALAAVQAAPGAELGIGWPAIIGAVAAGLAIFLLGRKRI
jgi:hypothetical protein